MLSTLLTGDIDFKNTGDLAIKVNDKIIESGFPLGICSLPHHGSDKNFSAFVSKIKIDQSLFVMSYGIKNPWPKSFPNYKTIADISKMGNRLIYVNEYQSFEYYI